MKKPGELRSSVGLCADCVHSVKIASDRGSIFYRCQLALTDARFAKYPRLPVVACAGYVQIPELKPKN
jgi:hypothetical protein